MAARIEDYGFLSDLHSAALVSRAGSVDWLAFPRFDSPSCFSALLGDARHGRWSLAPQGSAMVRRHYRGDSLVLETVFTTDHGEVAVIDAMPPRGDHLNLVRVVEGRRGRVEMACDLRVRFGYGTTAPRLHRDAGTLTAVAGPDAVRVVTPVALDVRDDDEATAGATFSVGEGDRVPFALTWFPSHQRCGPAVDALDALRETEAWWADWAAACRYRGPFAAEVRSSLSILKGLTYAPTGGVCAAATTSLPEAIGGSRNWDYRYCWLRDATFSLTALMDAGHLDEARAWRDWLLRAIGGDPAQLQIMYGLAGERELPEREVDALPGYEGSAPVRVGNAAADQIQLDVYGEVIDALHQGRRKGLDEDDQVWAVQVALAEFLEGHWRQPGHGLWEMRGRRHQFTHSKVLAWVAMDRMVRTAEATGLPGPIDRWRRTRADIRREVLERGVDDRGVLVQRYGSDELDASVLLAPIVGFLDPGDERVGRTIEALEQRLVVEGFLRRYDPDETDDGVGGSEGAFLMCTCWWVAAKALRGEVDEATRIVERVLGVRNDVGLLAEEYDPEHGRLLGNLPQAFSHTALVNAALTLPGGRPAHQHRSARSEADAPAAAAPDPMPDDEAAGA